MIEIKRPDCVVFLLTFQTQCRSFPENLGQAAAVFKLEEID